MSQTIHQRRNLALIKAAECRRRRANRDRDAIGTARHDHRSRVGEWREQLAMGVVCEVPAPASPEQEGDTDAPLPMMLFGAAIGLVAWALFGWAAVTVIDAIRGAL